MVGAGRPIDFFFNPGSIAVVGASNIPGKLSYVIMESLARSGFKGALYPVNPKYKEVRGLRCYPDVRSIGTVVDIAVFAVPAPMVCELFKGAGGVVKGAIVVSGGFSETGAEGKEIEKKLKEAALREGIRVIGPNCMGLYDAVSGVDTLFISGERIRRPRRGRISILSQSGSFALTAMDEFSGLGIGVARVVSYGNKVDVDEADCLDFLKDDAGTGVVIMYIEGIEDGRRFVESALRCSGKKTVLAWKVGKGGAALSAAESHTGAMAGRYEIYRAAFKKAGVIEVSGYEEFIDSCRVLDRLEGTKGNRVVIITDGGGLGVSIADACVDAGLDVAPLPENKKEALKGIFPRYFTVGNPFDLTGSVTDEWFGQALSMTLEGDSYDMAIVAALWGPPNLTDRMAEIMGLVARGVGKPVVVFSPGRGYARAKARLFESAGLPVFSTPEAAVRAASMLAKIKKKVPAAGC